ncbi:MAG TPA: recombinase family protein [Acidimicrobiales bacterium]|nr:recombinase family protein [Acidimicrobiales bacterium]
MQFVPSIGVHLGAQRSAIVAAVAASGDELVAVIDDPGQSGKDCNRAGLQRALRMIADGDADGLIATHLDRFTRSVRDMSDLMEWFSHHRYTLRLLDVGVDSSTAAGEVVLTIMAAVAQMIRKQTGEKTRAVLRDRKRQGLPISRPAAPSPIVERVKALYADGLGFTAIARLLDAEGVPTARGGAWQASTIQSILGLRQPSRRKRADLPEPSRRKRKKVAA